MVILYKFWDDYASKYRDVRYPEVRRRLGWVFFGNTSLDKVWDKTKRVYDILGGIDSPVMRKKVALSLLNLLEDGVDTDEIVLYDHTEDCNPILAVIQVTDESEKSNAYTCKLKIGDSFETRVMSRDELHEYFMWYGEKQKPVSLSSYLLNACV